MRAALVTVLLLGVIGDASASHRRGRRVVVVGESLQISPELKLRIADYLRKAETLRRQDGEWKEAVRFKRLKGGASSEELCHIGRRPMSDAGAKWLIRLSEEENAAPPQQPQVASNDAEGGFKLSVERVGEHLVSRVLGATKLPNGRTLEVSAELLDAKRQVPFEQLTWKGARGRLPVGTFVVRDDRGLVVAHGNLRALWRQARSRDGRWATRTLGLRVGELQELLIDLTRA